ncbi:unnamed protein product, partial [Rotaria sp. Silwood2]
MAPNTTSSTVVEQIHITSPPLCSSTIPVNFTLEKLKIEQGNDIGIQ